MLDDSKDVHIEIRFRNNRILKRMKALEISSVAELARRANMTDSAAHNLVNMKVAARNAETGEWYENATKLSNFFKCVEDDLFSHTQQYRAFNKNRIVAEAAFSAELGLSAIAFEKQLEFAPQALQLKTAITQLLCLLTPREERVMRMTCGLNLPSEMNIWQIGKALGMTGERARQIQAKALRKLRSIPGSTEVRRLVSFELGPNGKPLWYPRFDDNILLAMQLFSPQQ